MAEGKVYLTNCINANFKTDGRRGGNWDNRVAILTARAKV